MNKMYDWLRASRIAALAILSFCCVAPAYADAPDPAVQPVQSFYDTLLDSMKHAKALGVKGRYEKLKPAVEKSFDLASMLRAAVGTKWASLSDKERGDLLNAFTRKTVAEYASNFDGYGGEKFVVDPAAKARGTDKVVMSKMTGSQTVTFNYRLHQSNGGWKIFDIYLEGFVSQLTQLRSEYAAVLLAGGAPALTKQLNGKADDLLQGK
jgi:phospholipid transport system substrate-binding protein